jgi:type IV pilus assembly protein PilY1
MDIRHPSFRRLTPVVLAAAGLWLSPPQRVGAQQCDVPLMVTQGVVPPNVLIILDSSGSMREALTHPDYDPSVAWSGNFTAMTAYSVAVTGSYTPNSFNSAWPSSPSAPLVACELGQAGRYLGNYLNWIFFHATAAQLAALPQITKIESGKAAVQAILAQSTGLRYGLMRFNGDTGGTLVSPLGSSASAISSAMAGILADSWTPSAETMVDALNYFKSTGAGAPIEFACQENFIVFVTDGYPTQDLNVPSWIGDADHDGLDPGNCASIGAPEPNSSNCSGWLDDVAYYLAHTDLRSDMAGAQHVHTYTIGFGIDAPLLVSTAANGGGTYQSAWDTETLAASLGTVVGNIVSRVSAGAAVAVVSTEQQTGGHVYRGKFLPGSWRGYLEAYALPLTQSAPPVWEAGALLSSRSPSDRVVFTFHNGQTLDFVPGSADQLKDALGAANPTEAQNIISYVLGEDLPGYRDRGGWKLGDMVSSTPLVVGGPAEFHLDESYQQYLADQSDRVNMIYVGANDGMLHAFVAATGDELWAYVPQAALGKLVKLTDPAYCHQAFVDLSPVAYELKLGGTWRTVIVGGQRTGGDAYFAIDVTDPYAPQVMWETAVPDIRSSFTVPTLVRTHVGTFLWTGSGPDPGGTASIAVLDMEDGSLVYTATTGEQHTSTNMCTAASVYDADWDGYADFVYQGDLSGTLWRWDVRASEPTDWPAAPLFVGDQPIQARPTLAMGPDGDLLVYFGTGRYVEGGDLADTSAQAFYCVRDDGTLTGRTPQDLVDQTGSIHDVMDAPGWKLDLVQAPGERVVEAASVVEGVLYFTSFAPSSTACEGGGHSWLYHVDYRDGSSPSADTTQDRAADLGEGVASKAVVQIEESQVLVQTSDARINLLDMNAQPRRLTVEAWKEKFD